MRPSPALLVGRYRHLALTTKDVNKGFYKGNRTGSMGRHTKYGGYIIEWDKVRTYVVPENLAKCKVRPVRVEARSAEPRLWVNPASAGLLAQLRFRLRWAAPAFILCRSRRKQLLTRRSSPPS